MYLQPLPLERRAGIQSYKFARDQLTCTWFDEHQWFALHLSVIRKGMANTPSIT
jgi:hypothetical protein